MKREKDRWRNYDVINRISTDVPYGDIHLAIRLTRVHVVGCPCYGVNMKIETNFQVSCSESVFQIIGVTDENVKQLEDEFITYLKAKYENPHEIVERLHRRFSKTGEYYLELHNIPGLDDDEDWINLIKIANKLGYKSSWVSCTSDPICDDDVMATIIMSGEVT